MGFFNQKTKSHLNTYSIKIKKKQKKKQSNNEYYCLHCTRFEGSKKCHSKDDEDEDDNKVSKARKDTHMKLVQYVLIHKYIIISIELCRVCIIITTSFQ